MKALRSGINWYIIWNRGFNVAGICPKFRDWGLSAFLHNGQYVLRIGPTFCIIRKDI